MRLGLLAGVLTFAVGISATGLLTPARAYSIYPDNGGAATNNAQPSGNSANTFEFNITNSLNELITPFSSFINQIGQINPSNIVTINPPTITVAPIESWANWQGIWSRLNALVDQWVREIVAWALSVIHK